MGFWDKFNNPGTLLGGPIGGVLWDEFDPLGKDAQKKADEYSAAQAAARAQAKQNQLNLLGQLKGPSVSPQQEARIKALEQESQLSLLNDPSFQAAQQRATRGGAAALSAVQNKQAATGAAGGFQNVGSMQDVYDRLGMELADIGQAQTMYKEQKRNTAADMRQGIADAQIDFENAKVNARMAIEAGDAAAAQQAMQQAYAAREAIKNRTQQLILGGAQMAVGAFTGNPMAAAGGAQQIAGAGNSTGGAFGGQSVASASGLTMPQGSTSQDLQRQFNAQRKTGYQPGYSMLGY
jgi:hypothetical protein